MPPGGFDLAGDLRDYFRATEWESRCRSEGVVPDLATYVQMRRKTSGVSLVFDLIDLAERIELPARVRSDATVAALMTAAGDIIAWSNDIFSLPGDLADVGHLSLVVSLQRRLRLDLREAVARAARMHDARVRRFLELERALRSFGEDAAEAARFVNGLSGSGPTRLVAHRPLRGRDRPGPEPAPSSSLADHRLLQI
jgi:hypothetical protein